MNGGMLVIFFFFCGTLVILPILPITFITIKDILTEMIGIWYVVSNAIGASCGAITNFFLGRNWVFSPKENKITHQAVRYFLVATGSMILNTLGVYLLTEFTSLNYIYSKVMVAVFIAFTFNFLLQKFFVFK